MDFLQAIVGISPDFDFPRGSDGLIQSVFNKQRAVVDQYAKISVKLPQPACGLSVEVSSPNERSSLYAETAKAAVSGRHLDHIEYIGRGFPG